MNIIHIDLPLLFERRIRIWRFAITAFASPPFLLPFLLRADRVQRDDGVAGVLLRVWEVGVRVAVRQLDIRVGIQDSPSSLLLLRLRSFLFAGIAAAKRKKKKKKIGKSQGKLVDKRYKARGTHFASSFFTNFSCFLFHFNSSTSESVSDNFIVNILFCLQLLFSLFSFLSWNISRRSND